MGAKQSQTRSVSMDNPSPSGVIDISDDVVKRLKQGITQQAREKAATAEESKPAPKPQQPAVKKASAKTTPAAVKPAAPTVVYQSPTPIYVPGVAGGHTISAADVQRQMNQELQNNDELWRQRMTQLEENLKKTNTILESEYANAVENVHKRFVSTAAAHKTPPCQDLKAQLLACYRAHPGETLKCIDVVAQFRQCVDLHRIKKLDEEPSIPKAAAAGTKASVPAAKAG